MWPRLVLRVHGRRYLDATDSASDRPPFMESRYGNQAGLERLWILDGAIIGQLVAVYRLISPPEMSVPDRRFQEMACLLDHGLRLL